MGVKIVKNYQKNGFFCVFLQYWARDCVKRQQKCRKTYYWTQLYYFRAIYFTIKNWAIYSCFYGIDISK